MNESHPMRRADNSALPQSHPALHLPKQVQVATADGQDLLTSPQVNVRRVVEAARDVADRPQIHDHGAMHLSELVRVQLRYELFQRRTHERFARPPVSPRQATRVYLSSDCRKSICSTAIMRSVSPTEARIQRRGAGAAGDRSFSSNCSPARRCSLAAPWRAGAPASV